MGCYLWTGQWVRYANTGICPSNLAGKDVSAAETDTFTSVNIMRHRRNRCTSANYPQSIKVDHEKLAIFGR